MRAAFLVLALLACLIPFSARAADPPADPKAESARSRLLELLLNEEKVPERVALVGELAALGSPDAAKALVETLEKLAARTVQVEGRAVRTRQDYEPYKGAAQSNARDWALKKRLLEQMDREDTILRGDAAVLLSFGAGAATFTDKPAIGILDRAVAKAELAHVRRVLNAGLLRNPVTNAVEVARRGLADPDLTVRLATLQAFADRREPVLLDMAVKALADPQWTFRQAAALAIGVMGDVKGVGPLVVAMAGEQGRLLEDYADALTKLTNATLGPNPDAWKRWYEDNKDSLAAQGAKPVAGKLGNVSLAAPVDYYGIQSRSVRILFLIDCSGSMNEVIGQELTTGTVFQGKKIDIAKRMLKKAVSSLDAVTLFNVITFSTDARQMHERLVGANAENKYDTNVKVDELIGRGGTYTYGALKLAFGFTGPDVTPTSPPVDTIFLLSDGAPTDAQLEDGSPAEPMDPQKIIDAVRQWNPFKAVKIHTIAIDPRVEAKGVGAKFVRFMKDLALENGGTYTPIGGDK